MALRSLTADDSSAVAELFAALSPISTFHRFLGGSPSSARHYIDNLPSAERTLCTVLALEGQRVVAVGSLHPAFTSSAEVAITVCDDAQGEGIGTLLLQELASRGRELGLAQLTAVVSVDNERMLDVLRQLGQRLTLSTPTGGEVDVLIDLSTSEGNQGHVAVRAASARAAAGPRVGEPRTICIVHDLRHAQMAELVELDTRAGGFAGQLTSVCWPASVPDGTDVGVVLTSPLVAETAVVQCATAGAAAVVWPTRLRTREDLERRVVERARRCGVRLYGLPLGSGPRSGDAAKAVRPGLAPCLHPQRADMLLGDEVAVVAARNDGVLGHNQFAPITEQAGRRLRLLVPDALLRRGCLTWRKTPPADLSAALETVADCPEVTRVLIALDHPLTPADQHRVRRVIDVALNTPRPTSVEVRVAESAGVSARRRNAQTGSGL